MGCFVWGFFVLLFLGWFFFLAMNFRAYCMNCDKLGVKYSNVIESLLSSRTGLLKCIANVTASELNNNADNSYCLHGLSLRIV